MSSACGCGATAGARGQERMVSVLHVIEARTKMQEYTESIHEDKEIQTQKIRAAQEDCSPAGSPLPFAFEAA